MSGDGDHRDNVDATTGGFTATSLSVRTEVMPSSATRRQVAVQLQPSSPTKTIELPPNEARERLSWAAIQLGIAYLVIYALFIVTYTPEYLREARPELSIERAAMFPMEHAAAIVTILVSVAVFLIARGRKLPSQLASDFGLLYYVFVAFGISMMEHWEPHPTAYTPIRITWVCLWMTLYPMMVPATRGKLFLAAFACACAGPIVMLLSVAVHGSELPSAQVLAWLLVPPFVCFALAVYPTPHIHRLETALEKARELGSYKLTELLSKGGMGEVWKAKHRMLARPAAIKLVRQDVLVGTQPGQRAHALKRFEREAQIVASLCSPHTVQVYDFGITEDGSFYNVMELLDGLDLETLVRRFGPMPPERAVHFLLQACDSLSEAHSRKLIHRDIKPANLIACRYGVEVDFLKVVDFGLVRVPQRDDEGATRLTTEGMAAGTPAYIAPELARGDVEYDHRIDIYGLGCVGYWLLTGRTVFEAPNPMAMLLEHVQSEAELPSVHAPVAIPPALDRILMDCLRKDPLLRPRDAADLRAALEAIPCAQRWSGSRARTWWAEHHLQIQSAQVTETPLP